MPRFPEASEGLSFYAELATLLAESGRDAETLFPQLVRLVSARGPELLKQASADVDPARARARYLTGEDQSSPQSFFGRVLLQAEGRCAERKHEHEHDHDHDHDHDHEHAPPQLAVLRPAGDGTAMSLACALCFEEWPFPRAKCPSCAAEHEGAIQRLAAPEIPQIEARACEACRRYLNLVRVDLDPGAIPDVDELAAVALDVKAQELGYRKILPNLMGL